MSFILDALKKSENERARQNGPARLEARVVPRRRGVPIWAIALGVVLVTNLAVLMWMLTRATPQPVVAPAPAAVPPEQPPAARAEPVPPQAAPTTLTLPPLPAPLPGVPPADEAQGAAAVVNPADYRPALPRGTDARSADASLPSAAQLTATGLPALRLALHAYDDIPANRYVLLNSQRLREGDTAAEGVRVERITPEGVVLSWRGQQFRLQPGG
jgi:general secretion pathway protein B